MFYIKYEGEKKIVPSNIGEFLTLRVLALLFVCLFVCFLQTKLARRQKNKLLRTLFFFQCQQARFFGASRRIFCLRSLRKQKKKLCKKPKNG
jgi:hypothetical protein